ncbi:hypothetical protein KP509_11G029000 [Ceratopteris richardii]|nr:hypothetical protein KP509_11G029000 [Ceratopteris richardii]
MESRISEALLESTREHPSLPQSEDDIKVAEDLACAAAGCGLSDVRSRAKDSENRLVATRKLGFAVVLCLVFIAVEIVGGLISHSLAVLTDAAHLLSDVAGFAISLFAIWASSWEATPRQSYGFFRLEILGALLSIQLIWLLTGIIVYEAIYRMVHPSQEIDGRLMFFVAAFGFFVNVIMVFLLGHHHGHDHHGHDHHGHDHHGHDLHEHSYHDHHGHDDNSHDHHGHSYPSVDRICIAENVNDHDGHSPPTEEHVHADDYVKAHEHEVHLHDHEYGNEDETYPRVYRSEEAGYAFHEIQRRDSFKVDIDLKQRDSIEKLRSEVSNINIKGAWLHVLGDLIQSIGVMVGGAIIWWKPEWKIVDLICTLFFSIIVLGTTIKMLRDIMEVLMESTPREIDAKKLEKGLCQIEGVIAIHDLHIWAITMGKTLLACHVTIYYDADADTILQRVINYCEEKFNISHVTFQIERQRQRSTSDYSTVIL